MLYFIQPHFVLIYIYTISIALLNIGGNEGV